MQQVKTLAVTVPIIDEKPLTALEYIAYVARISSEREDKTAEPFKLVNYLMEHGHWSPFEHYYISFEIETNRAISAQLMRHRSATFQEFSQRYAIAPSPNEFPELRMQAKNNRQASTDVVLQNEDLEQEIQNVCTHLLSSYYELLDAGVAKECARMYLPMFTPTTVIMTNNLRGWYHFLKERLSPLAQKEIRIIAEQIQQQLIQHTGTEIYGAI
jgi:thymidylate synthase (FAD)